ERRVDAEAGEHSRTDDLRVLRRTEIDARLAGVLGQIEVVGHRFVAALHGNARGVRRINRRLVRIDILPVLRGEILTGELVSELVVDDDTGLPQRTAEHRALTAVEREGWGDRIERRLRDHA